MEGKNKMAKRIKSTTTVYVDEKGKESRITTLRDTSRDCLAELGENGIWVNGIFLFADGSYRERGGTIHRIPNAEVL